MCFYDFIMVPLYKISFNNNPNFVTSCSLVNIVHFPLAVTRNRFCVYKMLKDDAHKLAHTSYYSKELLKQTNS